MSHSVADGQAMVDAVQNGKRIFEAGSQRVSSILYAKARELYASGRLGEVHSIDAQWNRNSPGGAWSIPSRLTPAADVDWTASSRTLRSAPSIRSDSFGGVSLPTTAPASAAICLSTCSPASKPSRPHTAPSARTPAATLPLQDGREFPDFLETLFDYPSDNGPFRSMCMQPEQQRRR